MVDPPAGGRAEDDPPSRCSATAGEVGPSYALLSYGGQALFYLLYKATAGKPVVLLPTHLGSKHDSTIIWLF